MTVAQRLYGLVLIALTDLLRRWHDASADYRRLQWRRAWLGGRITRLLSMMNGRASKAA